MLVSVKGEEVVAVREGGERCAADEGSAAAIAATAASIAASATAAAVTASWHLCTLGCLGRAPEEGLLSSGSG